MPLVSYKLFLEMARRGKGAYVGDMSKIPLNYDTDDLSFLKQFPTALWSRASEKRFEMLHDALEEMHSKRLDIIKNGDEKKGIPKDFDKEIKKFLLSNESKKLSEEVHTTVDGKLVLPLSDDAKAEAIAEDDAFEIVKQETENLKDLGLDPKVVNFVMNKSPTTKSKKLVTIKAIPYLNRLYHRLERTRGEKHIAGSENENDGAGIGKYGYDLSHPQKTKSSDGSIKKFTRGKTWVGPNAWERSIKDYIVHSSHGHFGTHPRVLSADFSDDIEIKWLPMDGKDGRPKIYDPTYDWMIEDKEKRLKFLNDTEEKKLTPKEIEERAVAEINLEISSGKVFAPDVPDIEKDKRKFYINDKGKVISPFAYLPHEQINGQWEPLLNPSTYLETKRDDNGKRSYELHDIGHTGTHFGPTTNIKTVGINPNKNAQSRGYADTDVASNMHLKNNFDELLDNKGQIQDFIRGIRLCLKGNCGGASYVVKTMLLNNNIEDLHNLVYEKAIESLSDDSTLFDNKGRMNFARNIVSNYLQKAVHDQPPRRLRKGTSSTLSFSSIDGSSDIDPGTRGNIGTDAAIGRGGRIHPNITNIEDYLNRLKAAAEAAASVASSNQKTNATSADKLNKIIKSTLTKQEFFDSIEDILISDAGNTQEKASELIKGWIETGTDLDAVVSIVSGMIKAEAEVSKIIKPRTLNTPKLVAPIIRSPLGSKIRGSSTPDSTEIVDWKILSGLTFFERVEILKRIRRS